MTRTLIAALVFIFMLLGLERAAHAQLLSPGPLSKAHHSLEGDTHCSDCHSSGKQVSQSACLKCHSDLGGRINAGQGLHGRQYKGQPCQGCHVEHLGATPTKWPSGGPTSLDHGQTGWPLNGPHKTACNKCHTKAMPASGSTTYLGLSSTCTSCHKDQHAGRFGATCTDCHAETTWNDLKLGTFNHELANFKLRGAHTTVACANGKCHGAPPKYVGLKFALCGDCHTDPHAGKLGTGCADCHEDTKWKPVTFRGANAKHPGISLANGHAPVACGRCHDRGNLASPSRGSACVSCHKAIHKAPFGNACGNCHGMIVWTGLPRSIGLASHPKTAYPLTGKHEEVNCAGCHKPSVPRDQRYRQVAFARCIDCHQDKHSGEFAKTDGGDCKGCHSTAGYRPTLFGVDEHAQTKYPLAGKHSAASCSSCHTSPRPLLDLHVTKQVCADCHQNPHGDQFATQMAKGGCAECHAPAGWHVPKIDHSIWPLTGAHGTTPCDSCHHPTDQDRKAGHGASYRGVTRVCSGCHDDAHLGQFRLTKPVLECDKCHATSNFKIPEIRSQSDDGMGAHRRARQDRMREVSRASDGRGHADDALANALARVHVLSREPAQRAPRARAERGGVRRADVQRGAGVAASELHRRRRVQRVSLDDRVELEGRERRRRREVRSCDDRISAHRSTLANVVHLVSQLDDDQTRMRVVSRRCAPREALAAVRQLPLVGDVPPNAAARDASHDALPTDGDARARGLQPMPRARERAAIHRRAHRVLRVPPERLQPAGDFPAPSDGDDARAPARLQHVSPRRRMGAREHSGAIVERAHEWNAARAADARRAVPDFVRLAPRRIVQ